MVGKKHFQPGHEKHGGRAKGTPNVATTDLKQMLNTHLPEAELWKLWQKKLYSKDEHIALRAFELALERMFGKVAQAVVGEENAPPVRIDISAIPKFRVKV